MRTYGTPFNLELKNEEG
ncbi:Protein of unknown function [Bacillus mycoides]|nr:Protein of unknown function [Bacillus mycoides]